LETILVTSSYGSVSLKPPIKISSKAIYCLGDAAYVEDMPLFWTWFRFPGIEKVRERFQNVKNDDGELLI
jgi:hypothetical protein